MTTAREIDTPPKLEALAALTPTHYRESFTLPITPALSFQPFLASGPASAPTPASAPAPAPAPVPTSPRTAEQWARLVLEGASWKARAQMVTVWILLGIPLAPPWSRSQILGWRILRNTPTAIVLESRAAVGVTARLVFSTSETHLTQAMLIRYDHPPGRQVWSRLAPQHRRFIQALLTRAARSLPA